MGTAHSPLPASFSRFLSDAERWAAEGDRDRARRVLALAADLATPTRVPAVLLAWHAAGEGPTAAPRPATAPAPATPLVVAELDLAGLPIPNFPTAPPTVDLGAPRGMSPTPLALPVESSAPPAPDARLPAREPRLGGALRGIVVLALVAGAVRMHLPEGMKASLPGISLGGVATAAAEDEPRGHLVRGRALLAMGDTAGAAAALADAAQGDNRGAVAWEAAETLARLPGHRAEAADAYLLSYAAGLPVGRAETVARAQELAGRPDRARRVREQATAP